MLGQGQPRLMTHTLNTRQEHFHTHDMVQILKPQQHTTYKKLGIFKLALTKSKRYNIYNENVHNGIVEQALYLYICPTVINSP